MTVAPDGTAYAVDELTPALFRIDPEGNASVFIRDGLLQDTLDIPDFLDDVGWPRWSTWRATRWSSPWLTAP
ncbi:hypothetical protein ACSLFT_23520 [Streptomyces sp. G6]|uniref:hypothetical protein n=1 Tax=Streptomyces sp. G6 TaxID=1178736 RepID=UPI003EDAB671